MNLEPLSNKTLGEASNLVVRIFHSKKGEFDYPPKWLKASLNLNKNKNLYRESDIVMLKYWVAIEDKKVIGTIGLYTLKYDEKKAYWVAWYCVDPKHRKKGIGKTLFEFIITKSKKDGKKFLRLYTSKDQNERRANKIYDRLGFKPIKDKKINKIINSKKFKEFAKKLIYRELKLV